MQSPRLRLDSSREVEKSGHHRSSNASMRGDRGVKETAGHRLSSEILKGDIRGGAPIRTACRGYAPTGRALRWETRPPSQDRREGRYSGVPSRSRSMRLLLLGTLSTWSVTIVPFYMLASAERN